MGQTSISSLKLKLPKPLPECFGNEFVNTVSPETYTPIEKASISLQITHNQNPSSPNSVTA
jgi:hypothetical protein